jgi:CheY-like chemotaxis protein
MSVPAWYSPAVRILVADDDDSIRRLLAAYARSLGHEVLEAADGEEAVALALGERPGIVLADVLMPRLDGYGTLARLREAGFAGRVALVTALATPAAEPAPGCTPDAVLAKPFRRADVCRLLDELGAGPVLPGPDLPGPRPAERGR